ncbi:membrane protein [Patiriisocius marinistellae]|uniref:Membrane protein n=1 Tax=Patiriisocius marinistellae TaxID=2494560 RepID=A0A5J4FWT5_9FLAO|nr:hypothetical protein [Patiriisocius marinistellae]GEQ86483.1 membrane protein [Patiriisocius marinistellae]
MEKVSDPGKTNAIIAYITLIGWIIALVLNNNNKTSLASFHIRQMLGIMLVGLSISIIISITGIGLLSILQIGTLILWILGLIGAINEEEKPVPVVGEHFQKWFAGL